MVLRALIDTWHIVWRENIHFIRSRAAFLSLLIQPLIWLTLMGNAFSGLSKIPGLLPPGTSFLTFFTPGVIIMTTIFGGIWGGVTIVWDRRLGYLNKMLAAPISRTAISAGKIIAISIRTGIQVVIIGLVAFIPISIYGATIATGVLGFIIAVLIAMLLGLAFAGISMAIGAVVKNIEAMMPLMNLLTMPLLFLSSAMFPTTLMPDWLSTLTKFNPVTYAVDPIRALFLYGWPTFISDLWELAVVGIFALALVLLTTIIFRRSVS